MPFKQSCWVVGRFLKGTLLSLNSSTHSVSPGNGKLPPPISPTNGAAIAPWLDNVAAPYGLLNETQTVNAEEGRALLNGVREPGRQSMYHALHPHFLAA
jgi:hypothetical protein